MGGGTTLTKFLVWRIKNISDKNFVLGLSIIIGLLTGLAAVTIKKSVHIVQYLITTGFAKDYHNYLYVAYPLIGVLLTVLLIKYIIKQHIGHGIPSTLYAISKRRSILKRHNMFSSVFASVLTVGFGGSVGLEGPTVATGSAIGSNLGRLFHLHYKSRTLLIGCAAAGAMSSIFNAPIAAVIFAIEVLMLDLTMASIIPLLMASFSAAVCSHLFFGDGILFHYKIEHLFEIKDVPYYLLLGIVSGLVSLYFTRTYLFIEGLFDKLKNVYTKVFIGGLLLGIIIFILPPLYGEGYESINAILSGNFSTLLDTSPFFRWENNTMAVIAFLFAILLFKIVAASLTFGSGGIGGIFAPTFFMGGITGFLFAKIPNYFNITTLPESNFTLIGMGGLIAGVLHAPLTAIFLIADITKGYELLMPLMLTSVVSYITTKHFFPNSVYTHQLVRRGELMTHHKDKTIMNQISLRKVIERNFETVLVDQSLGELVKVVSLSSRNIYPVINDEGNLNGIILLDDIRKVMFNPDMYEKTFVRDFVHAPPAIIQIDDSTEVVIRKFEESGAWNLPVISEEQYVGFISKSKLFSIYRKMLVKFSED